MASYRAKKMTVENLKKIIGNQIEFLLLRNSDVTACA